MDKPRHIALLSLSILVFCSPLISQQRPPRPPASDFNIELINLEAPSFMASVPGAGARSGYFAKSKLRRIPTWKPSEEVPDEVSALRVQFWLEEGVVRVEVTAYLGQSEPDSGPSDWAKLRTARLASRLVREDEKISRSRNLNTG